MRILIWIVLAIALIGFANANIIKNPGFDSTYKWAFYTNAAGNFLASGTGTVAITAKGTNTQLYQYAIPLKPNTNYLLTFAAKAEKSGDIVIRMIKQTSPYTNYGIDDKKIDLTNVMKTYQIAFKSTPGALSDARLAFWLVPGTTGEKYIIDNVNLVESGSTASPTISTASAVKGLPSLANGRSWKLTFSDEFSGTSIDKTKWRGGYSELKWCPPNSYYGGSCANQYRGVSVSGGTLKLTPTVTRSFSTAYENRAMIHTGGNDKASAKFVQRYGYFEVRAKFPTNNNGEGNGLWLSVWALPIGKTNNQQNLAAGNQHEEVDIIESVLGNNMNYNYFNLHDYTRSEHSIKYPKTSAGDLSSKFHTYGMLWKNDGTKYGSLQLYFDGIAQGNPIALDSRSDYWDNGIYLILQIIPCPINNAPWGGGSKCTSTTSSNNPFVIDYVRVYKEI